MKQVFVGETVEVLGVSSLVTDVISVLWGVEFVLCVCFPVFLTPKTCVPSLILICILKNGMTDSIQIWHVVVSGFQGVPYF